jgi:nucleoredoxin
MKARIEKLQRATAEHASYNTLLGQGLLRGSDMCSTMDEILPKKVIGLYFAAQWSSSSVGFTPKLVEMYHHINEKCDDAFEIVLVSHDRDLASFCAQLADMPWLALPYQDRTRCAMMTKRFSLLSLPALILLDHDANIITRDGIRELMCQPPEAFPWPQMQLRDILGDDFVNSKGHRSNFEASLENKFVLLYFSALWVEEGVEFIPLLTSCVKKLKNQKKPIQVVFVSSDQSEADFNNHMQDELGDFIAIPFEDQERLRNLKSFFGLKQLPQLSIVGKDLEPIAQNAVDRIKKDSWGLEFPWGPSAVCDVADSAEGLTTEPCIILFCEQLEGDEKKAVVKEFLQAAQKYEKGCVDRGKLRDIFYFTAKEECSTADQLREYCSLKRGGPPTLAIIDASDNGAVYPCRARLINESTIENFVQQWRDGEESSNRKQAI